MENIVPSWWSEDAGNQGISNYVIDLEYLYYYLLMG